LVSERGYFGLEISSGLIRHEDGTFGVYMRFSSRAEDDIETVAKMLADDFGARARFATEREAQIAAFDMIEDNRRDMMSKPPPGLTWASEDDNDRVDEPPDM
jgi:hypothetical protein